MSEKHSPRSLARLVIIRKRRRARAHRSTTALRRSGRFSVSLALLLSLLGAFASLTLALGWFSLTKDLPPVARLEPLLDAETGLLRQPSRLVDRTGQHTLLVLAPGGEESQRIFLSYEEFPQSLLLATLVLNQPDFWDSPGYVTAGWQDPASHPTLAQQLVFDFLLADEPPSTVRALRERLLAADLTAEYGREQVLAWWLNSTDYGHHAVGAEAAAWLYFGKSAIDLSLSEASLLAFVGLAPALNPLDAPSAAESGRRETLSALLSAGWITPEEALAASRALPVIQAELVEEEGLVSSAFIDLALSRLDALLGPGRAQRGGAVIYTSIDYALQLQADCTLRTQLARLAGGQEVLPARDNSACGAGTLLPWLELRETAEDVTAGALVLDPSTGQVLSAAGDLSPQPAGTSITPFIYLAGFSRGYSPASLGWDIPIGEPLLGQVYRGPVRLRLALVSDYLPPARTLVGQVGIQTVSLTGASLGLDFPASGLLEEDFSLSPFDLSSAYGILAEEGTWSGQAIAPSPGLHTRQPSPADLPLEHVSVLLLTWADGSPWQDWSGSEKRLILSQQLSYLLTHVLGDVSARPSSQISTTWLEIGSPSAVKQARTLDGSGAWTVGYTPRRVVTVFVSGAGAGSRPAADGLWSALVRAAIQDLPAGSWEMPAGLATVTVCDPSGQLPTDACPNVVTELFLEGNQPFQYDTLFQEIEVNKETNQLATVFTPVELVEKRIYMIPPLSARAWALSAGMDVPPSAYDRYEVPPSLEAVHITTPIMFSDGRGLLEIRGSAAGEDFVSYRLEYGRGLNPDAWFLLGEDVETPVIEGLLGTWDTSTLDGLYTLRLMVVRTESRLEEALLQITLDNTPPVVSIQYPEEGQEISREESPSILYRVEMLESYLQQVIFYLDGEQVGTVSSAPFTLSLPSELGEHMLRIVVFDRAGNTGEATLRFTVVK